MNVYPPVRAQLPCDVTQMGVSYLGYLEVQEGVVLAREVNIYLLVR